MLAFTYHHFVEVAGERMNFNIQVCVKENQSTTDKVRILEQLASNILRIQQYDTLETVRITGIEFDVIAKNKINSTQIYVESGPPVKRVACTRPIRA